MIPEDHLEFLHAVWSRRTLFTFLFLGVNIAMFLLMEFAGSTTDPGTLMAFGVKSNPAINSGEWWRFIMPIFIHIGLLHLFFNSYALWMVGQQVEKLYGGARFVLIYVLTGIAGVLGSYIYNPDTISAGASGAIMGLFGALLVFGVRYRRSIPPFFKQAVGTGVLPVIVINLIIGFTIPAIDNSAHISGLLGGAVLAAIIPFQRPGEQTSAIFKAAQVALLIVVGLCFYLVASNYSGSPEGFISTLNQAQRTFDESAEVLGEERLEDLGGVRDQLGTAIDQVRKIPSLDETVDELMARLLEVLESQYSLVQDIGRAGTITFSDSRRLRQNIESYNDVMESFSEWVRDEGHKYGIQMGNRP